MGEAWRSATDGSGALGSCRKLQTPHHALQNSPIDPQNPNHIPPVLVYIPKSSTAAL